MPLTNRNKAGLDRKEFGMMTPAPVAAGATMFVIADDADGRDNLAMYVTSAAVQYLFHHDEDSWVQIPTGALGSFATGACGARVRWSNVLTANGGSTTTATVASAANLSGLCFSTTSPRTARFLTGTQAGKDVTITGVIITPGGTSTIQFAALSGGGSISNGDTFVIDTGRFVVFGAGTLAAGSLRTYDPLTSTWTSLATTGLPATVATDGKLVSTPDTEVYASGTATSATATTLVNAAKSWTASQWVNYQVRITGGLGAGQVRTITANTATTLTVATWTTTPDGTSTYAIEANADYLYFLGNNAITMYRYSFSGNTWTTLAPGVARTGAPGAGMTANHVEKTGDPNWANESAILDGRHIYSFRGGAGALLDRYDIAANSWLAVTYGSAAETFTTGTSACNFGRYIVIRKDATNRFFKFSVRGNYMEPLAVNLYPDGAGVLGNKLWIYKHPEDPTGTAFLYSLANTGTPLHRIMLF